MNKAISNVQQWIQQPIVPLWPRFHRMSEYAQPTPEVLLAPNTVSGGRQWLKRQPRVYPFDR